MTFDLVLYRVVPVVKEMQEKRVTPVKGESLVLLVILDQLELMYVI